MPTTHRRPPTTRVLLAIPLLACAGLVSACGSSGDASGTVSTAATRAAAVACPDGSASAAGAAQGAVYEFKNLTTVDVVYKASPPNCAQWWGTEFPAHYNGTEIPAMQAADPPVTMMLQPNPYVTKVDMTKVRTDISFMRADGSGLGHVVTLMNWRTHTMSLGSAMGTNPAPPVPNGTVLLAAQSDAAAIRLSVSSTHRKYVTTFTFTLRQQ